LKQIGFLLQTKPAAVHSLYHFPRRKLASTCHDSRYCWDVCFCSG